MAIAMNVDSLETDLVRFNRLRSRVVGGGLADASLGARGRHKRGTNIKVMNKLGNLNREEKKQ